MSIKDDISAVKNELTNEERFFESIINVESFYKKHKIKLIAFGVAVLFAIAGYIGFGIYKESLITQSNEIYAQLLTNPTDAELKTKLESTNAALFEHFELMNAVESKDVALLKKLTTSTQKVVKDRATYELAVAQNDYASLENYALTSDALLKDMANLLLAKHHVESKEYKKAKATLERIDSKSMLYDYALAYKHLLITKETK